MADNGYTKNYQDGQALTETKLDTAYKSLKLDISNTTQMTQGATAGHYLKCTTPGAAASFAALPSDTVSAKSADYTITDTDGIYTVLVTTGTAAITITLPTAADNTDRIIVIKKVDSGVGTVIIEGEAAETIEGVANKTLLKQYESIQVQCNGAEWYLISFNTPTYLEVLKATTSIPAITSGYFDAASLSIPVGEWEITGIICYFRNSATFTSLDIIAGISTTSGNFSTGLVQGVNAVEVNPGTANPPTSWGQWGITIPAYRVTVSSPTTYYLKGYIGNPTLGNPLMTARLSARRIKP